MNSISSHPERGYSEDSVQGKSKTSTSSSSTGNGKSFTGKQRGIEIASLELRKGPSLRRSVALRGNTRPKRWSRDWLHETLNSLPFLIFIILLIFIDIAIFVYAEVTSDESLSLIVVSSLIFAIFMLEIMLRIYASGIKFFKSPLNVIDMLLVLVSFVFIFAVAIDSLRRVYLFSRIIRVLGAVRIFFRLTSNQRNLQQGVRRYVSRNKRRFLADGFDLDLVYITDRVVGMSLPAQKKEGVYRNPIKEVVRFFDTKHPDHYMVYNLCTDKDYDHDMFHNRVHCVDIVDHQVPPIRVMLDFCKVVEKWMNADEENIIAVHCKGGKGRTGTMICAWLLYEFRDRTAEEILDWFTQRRTDFSKGKKIQGVDTPSQARYVTYFADFLKFGVEHILSSPPLKVVSIRILHVNEVKTKKGSNPVKKIARKRTGSVSVSRSASMDNGTNAAGVGYKQPYDNFGDGDDDDLALPQGALSWRAEVVEITALNERDHANAAALAAAGKERRSSSDGEHPDKSSFAGAAGEVTSSFEKKTEYAGGEIRPSATYPLGACVTTLSDEDAVIEVVDEIQIHNDCRFQIYMQSAEGGSEKMMCSFWMHTAFQNLDANMVMRIDKFEIDKAHKDKSHKRFPKDFAIEVTFAKGVAGNDGPV